MFFLLKKYTHIPLNMLNIFNHTIKIKLYNSTLATYLIEVRLSCKYY